VLLEGDILQCERQHMAEIPKIYLQIDEVRKSVLLNMYFNMFINELLSLKNTLAFIEAGDWERAANNMLKQPRQRIPVNIRAGIR